MDIANPVYQPTTAAAIDSEGEKLTDGANVVLKKRLGVFTGIAIFVGNVIGSGIFVSPKGVIQFTESVGLSLVVWVLSGVFSMIGVLCYAELGTSIVRSGGEYTYITEAFGRLPGFLCLYCYLITVVPTAVAIIALTFANYVTQPFFVGCEPPESLLRLLAACCITSLTFINAVSVKAATKVQIVFTIAKLGALALIIITGIIQICRGEVQNFQNSFEGSTTSIGQISLAFYSGLFAFEGWNSINMSVEEMENPKRNLPLVNIISMTVVTFVYVLANIAYFAAMKPIELVMSDAVAVTFAERLLGVMWWIIPISVGMSCYGAVNGCIFSYARCFFVGAREGVLPAFLGMINIKRSTANSRGEFSCCSSRCHKSATRNSQLP